MKPRNVKTSDRLVVGALWGLILFLGVLFALAIAHAVS
jgi:hypothetical protein